MNTPNTSEYRRKDGEWYAFELTAEQIKGFESIDPDFRSRNNIVEDEDRVYELVTPICAADKDTAQALTEITHTKIVRLLISARVPVSNYGDNPYIYSFPEFKEIIP